MAFLSRLRAAQTATGSRLCVGLDPDPKRLPDPFRGTDDISAVLAFCLTIADAVAPFACAFKPNLAFFEALGPDGWRVLAEVLAGLPEDRLVILDAKRGDIGTSAARYAHALYVQLEGDAVTVAPYMGSDSIRPFLQDEDRCAFVLAATSNPSALDFQDLEVDSEPLYRRVARLAVATGRQNPGEIGLVVGATRPEAIHDLRAEFPDTPFLVPGIGAQGGSAQDVLRANAGGPVLINSSRSILYASAGDDFADTAARAARETAAEVAL